MTEKLTRTKRDYGKSDREDKSICAESGCEETLTRTKKSYGKKDCKDKPASAEIYCEAGLSNADWEP